MINSVLPIIQKTYILKLLRLLYSQVTDAIETTELNSSGISSFQEFVRYFASYEAGSTQMKKLYQCLSNNPLLRSRLFSMRKDMTDGASISNLLSKHQLRVEWQLRRLYRIRNIATHLGQEIDGASIAVNHLHNYFDYAVNFILCKSENGDYIASISTVVFEAKNDNKIHQESLKENNKLNSSNYIEYLFGPVLATS